MRLTVYTDYALRVLTYLGVKPPGELATIKEIAGSYGISENHLMKVVHNLGQAEFVVTVRGRKGGMKLAADPAQISLGAVVRKCEEDMRLVECFDPGMNRCPITPACALPGILDEALNAFLGVLDRYTLADLLGPAKELRTILLPGA